MNDLHNEHAADYRVVHLLGSGADIGGCMAQYLTRVPSPFKKWPWEEDQVFLQECAAIINAIAPWLWHELAAFAQRLGFPPEQGLFVRSGSLAHGCSAVVWRTDDGRMLAGRTYDFYTRMRTRHLLITHPHDGYAHVGMNGGLVGGRYDGINEHGLFIALHKVMADRPAMTTPGVPYHLVARLALQACRTAIEATDLIMHLPHLASFNYTLADPCGTMIALECYPGQPVHYREGNGVLAVTNHYTSPDLARLHGWRSLGESQRRKTALEAIVERWGDPWEMTIEAISDHKNGVCCHREFGATLWAGVFDLQVRCAAYSFGAPCRRPMIKYELERT